ncbi:MAG TPA: methionine gamma-lyase family protein [Caldisericia bacterium]|nr:methionine gamma-lyase family protein [Caldisericia bacterium]
MVEIQTQSDSFSQIDQKIQEQLKPYYKEVDDIYHQCFKKVLNAFQQNKVSSYQLQPGFGYGLGDQGTQITEAVFSSIFQSENALVRPQITSGSHALFLVLNALLFKGDLLLSVTGSPYETLKSCIGIQDQYPGNLIEKGVLYNEINLIDTTKLTPDEIAIVQKSRLCWIQKSRGYSNRKTISSLDIKRIAENIRSIHPSAIIAVDNCYGEFTERFEPIECGADVCAGSFMKNPGGGIARTGGYIVGKQIFIDRIASHLVAPGLGDEFMPNLGFTYEILLGLFHSPLTVRESLKGNLYFSAFMDEMGFYTSPHWTEKHFDIVLEIRCKSKENMDLFTQAVQKCSPIDSHVRAEPFAQHGYKYPIIMAGGTFVPGSSIEFSADGFYNPPYTLYFQPGLYAEQTKIFAEYLWQKMTKNNVW